MLFGVTLVHAAEAAHDATTGGIGALGINLQAFLFQIANFAILLWLLKRFVYKPLLRMIEKRRKEVVASLKNAETIAKREKEQKKEGEKLIKRATEEAETIVAESHEQANRILAESEIKAKERTQQLLKDNQAKLDQEVERLRQELKKETLQFVALATEQLIDEKVDSTKDEALIQRLMHKTTENS